MIKKNKYGQYFTVEDIAEFMVSLIKSDKEAKVLEPSCGKGVFIRMLQKHGYDHIRAYEIDKSLNNPYDLVEYASFVSSPLSEKFNVVIGNPPYIRWKNLEQELKNELAKSELWNKYFNSLCDYLFIFILKSIEQLKDGGELIFICPEYWMNTTHSSSLRNYMVKNGHFSDIYQFKESPLFEGVTSSFVIFRYVKTAERSKDILLHHYLKRGKPSYAELASGEHFATESIPAFKVGERWLLTTQEKQDMMNSFERGCMRHEGILGKENELHRIGDYCDIGNGMVSGLDKAFKVSDINVLNEKEKKALIKVNKAKDLSQYFSVSTSYYFFIEDDMSEDEFKTNYPNFYAQLQPYKELLGKRYSYGRDLPIWQFAFPRNERLFKRQTPHIFVPCKERISVRHYFRFAYADTSYYPLQDVTGIFQKNGCKEDVMYLLAYLNNERVFEWLKYNGIIKGEIVEFSEAPIASIPYRLIKWNKPKEVLLHDTIVEETKNYLNSKDIKCKERIDNCFNILFNGTN